MHREIEGQEAVGRLDHRRWLPLLGRLPEHPVVHHRGEQLVHRQLEAGQHVVQVDPVVATERPERLAGAQGERGTWGSPIWWRDRGLMRPRR
jgi:hypothetical protein